MLDVLGRRLGQVAHNSLVELYLLLRLRLVKQSGTGLVFTGVAVLGIHNFLPVSTLRISLFWPVETLAQLQITFCTKRGALETPPPIPVPPAFPHCPYF